MTSGTTSEILDLATMEWRSGPELPRNTRFPVNVQYGDTFAMIGGYDFDTHEELDTVHLFDPEVRTFK